LLQTTCFKSRDALVFLPIHRVHIISCEHNEHHRKTDVPLYIHAAMYSFHSNYLTIYDTHRLNIDEPHQVWRNDHSVPWENEQHNIWRNFNTKKNELSGRKI
jgi:hypothetical protein